MTTHATSHRNPTLEFMRVALRLARRGYGATSPNPMVGAVLVKGDEIIGHGWHRKAGLPHAEIEAIGDAEKRGRSPRNATLYVTLEPCCTCGRTPPCTEAIIAAGIRHVVVGTIDPAPRHAGRGLRILREAGIEVEQIGQTHPHPLHRKGARARVRRLSSPPRRGRGWVQASGSMERVASECAQLNEAFNHWIVHRTPFVTVKAAMTLDGKIAGPGGQSKWITGEKARAYGMTLRKGSDAILVGINTILADNPSLTVRSPKSEVRSPRQIRRIILDSMARTPLHAKVVSDEFAALTTVVVSKRAPRNRVAALAKRVNVVTAPGNSQSTSHNSPLDLGWLLKKLGSESITSLLVEGGGEVNASFLLGGLAQRAAFFYAPKILGGRDARRAVAGDGILRLADAIQLRDVKWRWLGTDLLLTALLESKL